ncbi:TlpA disulfide reductase family protein [Petrimonas sp.]|uniref:TlpA family protein disulfide reductase n=1 Tax=Petrimonas sp. TaxID=2023866 RepID=UPI0030D4BD08
MKHKTILFLSLILILSVCQRQKENRMPPIFTGEKTDLGEKAIITGKIINRDVYPHVKLLEITLPDFYGNEAMYTAPLTEDGLFRFEIYPITTLEISFVPVEDRIVIAPGDSLYIEKDFQNITHTVFRGTSAELNKHINAFRNQYLGRYSQPYELSFSDYKAETKKQYDETLQKLAVFQQENSTSETFNTWAKKQVALDYYNALFLYPYQHTIRTKKEPTGKEREMYYDFVKEFEREVDNSIIMADNFKAVNGFSRYVIEESYPEFYPKINEAQLNNPQLLNKILEKLKSGSKNVYLSQFAFAGFLNIIHLQAHKTDWIDSNRVMINKIITDPFLRATLNNQYNQVKAYNTNPRVYSDAVLGRNAVELHGRGSLITDSANIVKQVLYSNPGKVVYVDICATWCGPCMRQMPYSKALHEELDGKPIVFAYLWLDGETERGKNIIASLDLPGIHIALSDKEWQDINKRFNTKSSVPYFLLFDKNGVMVDFGNHILPSLPGTKTKIDKLLEE